MKVIHIKSQESVALPIYTSELGHLYQQQKKKMKTPKKQVRPGFCEVRKVRLEVILRPRLRNVIQICNEVVPHDDISRHKNSVVYTRGQ